MRLFAQFYQERLRLFETLVNNSPDGIGVSGLDGKQIHPNPAFRALLGYGDELIGMHFSEYIEGDDPAIMQQLTEQGFWQGTNIYRRKDGRPAVIRPSFYVRFRRSHLLWVGSPRHQRAACSPRIAEPRTVRPQSSTRWRDAPDFVWWLRLRARSRIKPSERARLL